MPKTSLLALAMLLAATVPSSAQRASSTAMTCGQAAAHVRAQGATVLGTGGMSYDRFVSERSYCAQTEQTKPAFAPTRDNPYCMIGYTCFEPFVNQNDQIR